MERETIWEALKKNIFELFPEYKQLTINPTDSLRELGANSVDRAEIIMLTLSHLKLQIPLIEFAKAKNLDELVDIFYQAMDATCQEG